MDIDFYKRHFPWIVAFVLAVLIVSGYRLLFSPPSNFPSGDIVVIAEGSSAPHVAEELAGAHVIARPFMLELMLRIGAGSTRIQAGAYLFKAPQNLFTIAYRLVAGDYGLPLARITFIEGVTVREMAAQVAEIFPTIPASTFFSQGQSQEGYLFPDTYLFQPSADAASILKTMRANFDEKITPLASEIQASGYSLSDIVIMASLIEKEARTDADRHLVAGILWKRLELGMPLQVDAARDTYTHTGLPAAPICNPGLDSIESTLHPTKTDYLYYLTGKDDLMHYATTFAGHQANVRKYLH